MVRKVDFLGLKFVSKFKVDTSSLLKINYYTQPDLETSIHTIQGVKGGSGKCLRSKFARDHC